MEWRRTRERPLHAGVRMSGMRTRADFILGMATPRPR